MEGINFGKEVGSYLRGFTSINFKFLIMFASRLIETKSHFPNEMKPK